MLASELIIHLLASQIPFLIFLLLPVKPLAVVRLKQQLINLVSHCAENFITRDLSCSPIKTCIELFSALMAMLDFPF